MTGVGVPDQGDAEEWEVPEDRSGLKVAQIGSQGLPQPVLGPRRVHVRCGQAVAVTYDGRRRMCVLCPGCGSLAISEVTTIWGA